MAHAPRQDPEDPTECQVCGRKIVGSGHDMRHAGETITIVVPEAAHLTGFQRALAAATHRAGLLPADFVLEDAVRCAVEGVYLAGLLRTRPGERPDALRAPEPRRNTWDDEDADRAARIGG